MNGSLSHLKYDAHHFRGGLPVRPTVEPPAIHAVIARRPRR